MLAEGSAVASAPAPAAARSSGAAAAADTAAVGRGATGTNLQEQDVDEPDRAKLRGGQLVVLAQQRLTVLATSSATPTVVSSFPLDPDGYAAELLLEGDRAVVVSQGGRPAYGPAVDGPASVLASGPGGPTTSLLLFDLSDPAEPELLEEATLDGEYLSARLVDGTVRLVTSSTPQVELTYPRAPGQAAQDAAVAANQAAAQALPLDAVLPQLERRTGTGRLLARGPAVGCEDVAHALDGEGSSTLLVTTLRPQDGLAPTDTTAVTAYGDLVYASADRLYVGTSRWGTTGPVPVSDLPGAPVRTQEQQVTTQLHAFDTTSRTRTRYVGTGSVDGYVLGRWALSEHEGALRVATTLQPPWDGAEQTSSSLTVLRERDGALVEVGRVDGLGEGERIQAVRYLGDVAAVVTFRQTDPLYLLDLSDETRAGGDRRAEGDGLLHLPAPARRRAAARARQRGQRAGAGDRPAGVGVRRARPGPAAAGRPAAARPGVEHRPRRQPRLRLRPRLPPRRVPAAGVVRPGGVGGRRRGARGRDAARGGPAAGARRAPRPTACCPTARASTR